MLIVLQVVRLISHCAPKAEQSKAFRCLNRWNRWPLRIVLRLLLTGLAIGSLLQWGAGGLKTCGSWVDLVRTIAYSVANPPMGFKLAFCKMCCLPQKTLHFSIFLLPEVLDYSRFFLNF